MWMYLRMMDPFWPDSANKTSSVVGKNGSLELAGNRSTDANDTYDYLNYNQVDGFEQVVRAVNKFVTPLIIFGGLIGNSLSFAVFVTSHLKLQSCSIYLAFLNVVDSLFLLCLVPQWLGWFGIFVFHAQGWCQLTIYCSYVTSFLSAWGVVSFTVERYIVVYHPLHKQVLCTRYKAIVTVVSLTAVALAFYSVALFVHGMVYYPDFDTHLCTAFPGFDRLMRVMTGLDTVLTLVLPSVAIVVLNIAITIRVWEFMLSRHLQHEVSQENHEEEIINLERNTRDTGSSSNRSSRRTSSGKMSARPPMVIVMHNASHETRRAMKYRTTRSLLVVSTVFVVLNLPVHSLRTHAVLNFLLHTDTQSTAYLNKWINILQFLSFMNYSANFLLYCACSWGFRNGLRRLCSRIKRSYQRSKLSFMNLLTLPTSRQGL